MASGADIPEVELEVGDTNTAGRVTFPLPPLNHDLNVLPLPVEPENGMQALKLTYDAGFANPVAHHRCAHGCTSSTVRCACIGEILVLELGPVPRGWEGEHGAKPDQDYNMLFVTNKPFDIGYRFED